MSAVATNVDTPIPRSPLKAAKRCTVVPFVLLDDIRGRRCGGRTPVTGGTNILHSQLEHEGPGRQQMLNAGRVGSRCFTPTGSGNVSCRLTASDLSTSKSRRVT